MTFNIRQFRFREDTILSDYPTQIEKPDQVNQLLQRQVQRISDLQKVLFADGRRALLLIFQGMDCSGKDSTIKHVLSGVNPQGVNVASFREPTHAEESHSYLWRYWQQMPKRGMMGVFNRSHYEEVVVMRVHPEYFVERKLPHPDLTPAFWRSRCEDLAGLEDHLTKNAIHVVKFFLHLSPDEQRNRLLGRIDRADKNWKFDPRDVVERSHWDAFQHAYNEAITATDTEDRPWYIIPADHKPTMRALVAQITADTLSELPIAFPEATAQQMQELQTAKAKLLEEEKQS